jgi:hypothetical protein
MGPASSRRGCRDGRQIAPLEIVVVGTTSLIIAPVAGTPEVWKLNVSQ